jgi:DNA gyrase/topoisomerase IV subunit B
LTDRAEHEQDHDGSHIKGLILNFLDHFYPSLLKIPGFLVEFITPIVKVWKGKQEITFYTMPEYEEWKEQNNNGRGWESKYYKVCFDGPMVSPLRLTLINAMAPRVSVPAVPQMRRSTLATLTSTRSPSRKFKKERGNSSTWRSTRRRRTTERNG